MKKIQQAIEAINKIPGLEVISQVHIPGYCSIVIKETRESKKHPDMEKWIQNFKGGER